jgi:hypothetical protein
LQRLEWLAALDTLALVPRQAINRANAPIGIDASNYLIYMGLLVAASWRTFAQHHSLFVGYYVSYLAFFEKA